MRVTDIIRRKGGDVVTLPSGATIAQLIAALTEHRIGAVLVMDGTTIAGIVSERDVVRHLHAGTGLDRAIREVMSAPVITCAPGDELQELATVMTAHRLRHLPVVADGRLLGIVSIGDVVKARLDELEAERDQLTGYITG